MNKRFALIGVGGYIAPRHMKAIKDTENILVAAMDKNDSVGILDSYFPQAEFFTEYERFDRHLYKLKRKSEGIHYLSVCSPNYLHDAHIRFGLRMDADVICEKPLVLNPWNIDALNEMQEETGRKVYTILQLRVHPKVIELKNQLSQSDPKQIHKVELTYITSRGKWYHNSWKGDLSKSGGIATNIGVHFYDLLSWLFGNVKSNCVHLRTEDTIAGALSYKHAEVRYFLSINEKALPEDIMLQGKKTYRSLMINGSEFEFSEGFTDLHTVSYQQILSGRGFGLEEARASIETVHYIRNAKVTGLQGDHHPLAEKFIAQ